MTEADTVIARNIWGELTLNDARGFHDLAYLAMTGDIDAMRRLTETSRDGEITEWHHKWIIYQNSNRNLSAEGIFLMWLGVNWELSPEELTARAGAVDWIAKRDELSNHIKGIA